jgi:hypothetical protein
MSGPVSGVESGLRTVRPDSTTVPSIGVCRDVVGEEDQTLGCLEGTCRCQPVPASSKLASLFPVAGRKQLRTISNTTKGVILIII